MDVSQRSTAELVAESLDDVTRLLRKEAELLRIGIVESLMSRLKGAGLVALAVVLALPGLLFLIVGAALWLPWSAQLDFLVAGAALLGVAGIAIAIGVRKVKKGDRSANEALEKVKEDARWARGQLKR